MTNEDIIRMAREAGSIDSEEVIETVWNAFSAAEREACARVCEGRILEGLNFEGCAASIRARKDKQ